MWLIDVNALVIQAREEMYAYEAESFADWISKFPTVDAVEVVHGRWIGEVGGYMWRQNCSVCNGPVYNKMKPYYNYCPYCGAKMDLED